MRKTNEKRKGCAKFLFSRCRFSVSVAEYSLSRISCFDIFRHEYLLSLDRHDFSLSWNRLRSPSEETEPEGSGGSLGSRSGTSSNLDRYRFFSGTVGGANTATTPFPMVFLIPFKTPFEQFTDATGWPSG